MIRALRHRVGFGRQDGFTLSEMLTSMVVLGALLALASTILASAIRHSDEVEDQSVMQAELRGAIEQFGSDLRQTYSGDETAFPIESISPTQITFLSPDRSVPFHLRRITYRVSAGRFERRTTTSTDTDGAPWTFPGTTPPWLKQAERITNTSPFRYFDANGSEITVMTNPSSVQTVRVRLTAATNSDPGRPYTYETSVTMRADA
jgi:prepilin-type N-terminal cleavage/methylation domain-containing protein